MAPFLYTSHTSLSHVLDIKFVGVIRGSSQVSLYNRLKGAICASLYRFVLTDTVKTLSTK